MSVSTYQASDGAAYEKFLGRWTKLLAPGVLDFADFRPNGSLLDCGTGTGSLACAMAARWPSHRVVGIDIAAPYIEFACGTAAQLVLNFVPNAKGAVGEMRRVTKPGGKVVAAVWDFRGGLVYQRILWDTAAGLDPQAAEARDRLFSGELALPDGLPRLFSDAGLVDVQRGSITIRMEYTDFDDYWQPLLTGQGPFGAYVAALSPDMRHRIQIAVKRAYCAGSPDGERSMTATAWVVRGRVP